MSIRLRQYSTGLSLALLLSTYSLCAQAEIHPNVQAALDWQMPLNQCKKPRLRGGPNGVLVHDGTISHTPTNTTENSSGVPMVFEIDHYQVDRYHRKKKRWESCVSKYKSKLQRDFDALMNSAQYGLSKQQAESILGKLAKIQAAMMSPDGIATSETTKLNSQE